VRVTAATLRCSRQPEKAAEFAEFLASPDAAETFRRYGYTMKNKELIRKLYANGRPVAEK
jgi:ABC-type molybdate transport system substrate-binding protein